MVLNLIPAALAVMPGFSLRLFSGLLVWGSCFPKDTRALAELGKQNGVAQNIVETVIEVNEQRKTEMVEKVISVSGGVVGKRIAVLGLSFKPNTDDIRESPATSIALQLIKSGAQLVAYDPEAMPNVSAAYPEIELAENAFDAITGADVLVIMTEWNEFRAFDMQKVKEIMSGCTIVDLRNLYEPKEMEKYNFKYYAVGKKMLEHKV